MKQCFKCKKTQTLDSFKWRNKAKGIKFSYCNNCMIKYRHLHYLMNKNYYLNKARLRNKRIRKERATFILDYLSKHPCVDCGNDNPAVLEFDHKNKENKNFNIGNVLYWGSFERIQKEIDKCEVRCANCHKIKTSRKRNWQKASSL